MDDLRRDRRVREALRALTAGARQIGAVCGFLFGAVIASITTMLVLRRPRDSKPGGTCSPAGLGGGRAGP
jgi:hypothetical protein